MSAAVPLRRSRSAALAAIALVAACSAPDQHPTAPPSIEIAEPSLYTYPSAIFRSHVEFGTPAARGELERSVYGKVTWQF